MLIARSHLMWRSGKEQVISQKRLVSIIFYSLSRYWNIKWRILSDFQAFKRHASLGFLAASAFPIPKDYVKGITLPAQLSVDEWDEFHDSVVRRPKGIFFMIAELIDWHRLSMRWHDAALWGPSGASTEVLVLVAPQLHSTVLMSRKWSTYFPSFEASRDIAWQWQSHMVRRGWTFAIVT